MFDAKLFKKTRHLACYNCECTGYYNKKSIFLKLFSWEIKLKKKAICHYCSGRGFVTSTQKIFFGHNDYRSFLDH